MSKKVLLEQANALLKAAKEKPEQFKELTKTFDGMDLAAGEKNPQAAAEARIKVPDDKTHEANWAKYKGKKPGEKSSDYTSAALKAKIEKEEMTDNNPIGAMKKSEPNKETGMAADKGMSKEEILKAAKGLIELAKNEPAKFEELTKAMAAPAPAPAAPKAPAAAPKMPAAAPAMMKPKAPGAGGMRMSKDEIKADLAKPFTPKHPKKMAGC